MSSKSPVIISDTSFLGKLVSRYCDDQETQKANHCLDYENHLSFFCALMNDMSHAFIIRYDVSEIFFSEIRPKLLKSRFKLKVKEK